MMTVALGGDYESPNSLASKAKKKLTEKPLTLTQINTVCEGLLALSGRAVYLRTLAASFENVGNTKISNELNADAGEIDRAVRLITGALNLPKSETQID